ncbi:hypothetical protein B7463_g12575, partial [Scytalidium lignicola]
MVQLQRMGGRYSDIAWSFLILTLPILLLACVLLGLVFHYRVTSNGVPFENLSLSVKNDETGIYYVNFSPTILVFIASRSSSLAPALAGFALALVAYPVARKYLKAVRAGRHEQLLTPYQLFLTIRFLDGGGASALWNWFKYLFSWRKHRVYQPSPLSVTASVAVLSMVLGIAVFLADTWLHVTTRTVNFVRATPVTSGVDYSFGLLPGCTLHNNSFGLQIESNSNQYCSLNIAATAVFLINGTQSISVLNNASDIMTVLQYQDTPYVYLGVPASETLSLRDYTATTFGMSTQCKAVSNECNLNALYGASTPFHCTDAFSGDVTEAPNTWVMAYFADSTMQSNVTTEGIRNPYYLGIAALVNPAGGASEALLQENTPEIVRPIHGGISFVLSCSVIVYDIEYDSVNGTVSRFVVTPSNDSVANIWQGAMALTTGNIGLPNLLQAASFSAFSNSAQEVADRMALAYSRVSLAIGSQAVEARPALAAQEREYLLVARVPAAPLFALVIANLLFVAMGFILMFMALATSGGEVREVKARLGVEGLIADRFESTRGRNGVEDMKDYFEEIEGNGSLRVGIDCIEGKGYAYREWQRTE